MIYAAYIVDCVRTAGGKKNGRLSKWHPSELGASCINALLDRNPSIPPSEIDDVIIGCVSQIGSQAGNIGRSIVLASKLPETVPGCSVDRQCGSSQQSIHFAAQGVMSGTQNIVIAGGVEVMSLIPIGSNILDGLKNRRGSPQGPEIMKRYKVIFSQFEGAELLAKKYNINKKSLDQFAVQSHLRAERARINNAFDNEIITIEGWDKKKKAKVLHSTDEGIRSNTTLEKVRNLRTLKKNGIITAATSSQICDGASAILICNERGLKKYNLNPRAKIISLALAGSDPVIMLEGPISASKKALKQANLSIKDIDLYEINEAFASVPLAWNKALGGDLKKLNINGGAMALGHPLGATGAKIMTTLVNALEKTKGKFGIQAICEGGGTANATIIEICEKASSKL